MEVTLDKLLSGKPTKINNKDYLSTEDYVKPFIDFMDHFSPSYRIEAIPPSQVTMTNDNEDLTYNRVLVQAILPNKIGDYNEMYALTYSLDIRKPLYKIYRALYNNQTGATMVFNPDWIIVKEIQPLETFELPIKDLMEYTDTSFVRYDFCQSLKLSTKEKDRCLRYGRWLEKCYFLSWSTDLGGKIKWSAANIIKVYNSIYIDHHSNFYVGDKDSSVLNTYNAFADIVANDHKDICNRFEKTMLINSFLEIK